MPQPSDKTISKFLSLVLRHKPGTIGLTLDENGWADVEQLLERCAAHDMPLTREKLETIVAQNDKQRFAFSGDGSRIRASQGHSVAVDLGLSPTEPPAILYHGTAERNLAPIQEQGLIPGERQQVHLSADRATARAVGARYGKPVVLVVDAAAMQRDGYLFYCSANAVWLTGNVPPSYLSAAQESKDR
ncbi:RNA 2'-phosphotransferase [Flaviaesturariibacter terrae]